MLGMGISHGWRGELERGRLHGGEEAAVDSRWLGRLERREMEQEVVRREDCVELGMWMEERRVRGQE